MAITVLNTPTTPNVTGTKLVYAVSSSNATQPQFQYVTDVYLNDERLTRLLTYPNPQGYGVLEVSSIFDDNLEFDNDWKTTDAVASFNAFKTFELHFSESYGSSISSSVNFYAGGASEEIKVFPGTVPVEQGSFNFLESGSFAILSNTSKSYISKNNYVTVPVYVPQGSSELTVKYLDNDGAVLLSQDTTLVGPETSIFQFPIASGSTSFNSVYNNQDWEQIQLSNTANDELFLTIYRVRPCDDDGVTFAFINNYGYYEFYSIGNPVRKNSTVTRDTADLPFVDYSNVGTYDVTRRGTQIYNVSYEDTFDVTTDYLDAETANWLTELFDSPEVYVQENGTFIPVIITDTNYQRNTNQNRQKLFQYTFTYKYANARYSR